MSTRIQPGGPATGVAPTTLAPRVTPPPARPFEQVLSAGSQAVIGAAEGAVRALPGGPILAAAFRGPSGNVAVTSGSLPEGSPGTAGGASGGGSGGSAPSGVEGALAQSAEMNLYYLQLQERMNAENRTYTTLSNVLKAQHDTVKNAISNVR